MTGAAARFAESSHSCLYSAQEENEAQNSLEPLPNTASSKKYTDKRSSVMGMLIVVELPLAAVSLFAEARREEMKKRERTTRTQHLRADRVESL